MTRIALWVDRFPVVSETFVVAEADALAALGAAVRVEAHDPAGVPDPDAAARWPARFVGASSRWERLRALTWLVVTRPRACARDLRARRRWQREEWPLPLRVLAPAVRRAHVERDEHLHAHFAAGAALSAMRVAALLDLPWSVTVHGYDLFLQRRNLAEKLARAAFATTGSSFTLAALGGPRSHRIVMGVDLARFRRPDDAARPVPGRIVAVGRLVPKKGFAVLLKALRDVPGASLVLIGDGPLREELSAQAAALGDRVTLAGALPTARVREELLRAAVVCVPCVIAPDGDADSMPVVAKEALALEIPVVSSDAAGLPEVVMAPHGIAVPAGDAAALAAALREVLGRDDAGRAAMGAAGRAWVADHADVHRETARLLGLIEQAVGSAR